jgi:glycosyltransferase involved in cell wall biosynthesis
LIEKKRKREKRNARRGTDMRIAMIAPPWIPVPPPSYGGTEAVIDRLARGLQDAGHSVLLVCHPESTCPVERVSVVHDAESVPIGEVVRELTHVIGAYRLADDADIVHDHTCGGPLFGAGHVPLPIVATNHGPFDEHLSLLYRAAVPPVHLVGISRAQASTTPLPVRVIHHGVDVDTFPNGGGGGGYLLFLGRMHPSKGVHLAIRAARAAGWPLVIAAKMREAAERVYFEREVEPLLGDDVRYVGEADAATKLQLLANADALVNPIVWPEPFGMVMLEALACGTPVVAMSNGAAPEIVDHARTGFLAGDVEGIIDALRRVHDIDRGACRAAAARFSVARMVDRHVVLYDEVVARRTGRELSAEVA